jgi:hypothetical protein
MNDMPRILYVGEVAEGTTCAMRANALESLGYSVDTVTVIPSAKPARVTQLWRKMWNRLRRPEDVTGVNRTILQRAFDYDILWIDKGNVTAPATLAAVRRRTPRPLVIGFSPDDMEQRHCTSVHFHATLPFYDAFITTKSFHVAELGRRGCPCVVFVDNGYDPATHRPMAVPAEMRAAHESSVGFIGYHERERERSIARLAEAGLDVKVYGPGWEAVRRRLPRRVRVFPGVFGEDYAKTISAIPINLGFLRKCNRDLQTTRSVEIPACGGFLLAERTHEHQRLFIEGEEAEFFGDDAELIQKAKHYLTHPAERQAIASRGRQRCLAGRYSYAERIQDAIAEIAQRIPWGFGPRPVIH